MKQVKFGNQIEAVSLFLFLFQMKYKETGKKDVMSSLYSTLPETLETQHAKEASQLQSQVQNTHMYVSLLANSHICL